LSWWEVSLIAAPELAEAVAEVFHRFAPGGVAMEPAGADRVRLVSWVPVTDDLPRTRRRLNEALGHLSLIMPVPPLEEREVPDQDWLQAFREGFRPFHIGQRFVITPSWASYTSAPGETVLVIDPGLAFGTGLHPTTQTCLLALERLAQPGMAVLDLGAGSGILAIAAAKLGVASVLALDTDPDAVRSARENLAANGVPSGVVTVVQGTLEGTSQPRYDLVAANLTAGVLTRLAPQIAAVLRPGAALVAGGILEEQAASVADRFQQEGLHLQDTLAREDWRTLVFRAPDSRSP